MEYVIVGLVAANLALAVYRFIEAEGFFAKPPEPVEPCGHAGCSREPVHVRKCPDGHPLRPNYHSRGKAARKPVDVSSGPEQ